MGTEENLVSIFCYVLPFFCQSISLTQSVPVSFIVIARCRQASCNIAKLHLSAPMDFSQNFTPFFSAAGFCATKIGEFKDGLKNENYLKYKDIVENKEEPKVLCDVL